MQRRTKEFISVTVSLLLVFTPTLSAAGIEVDGTTNTTLESAQNGVQVVNIANPNAQGLSHNKYTHYNVSKDGLILNNSMDTSVKTQLGGYIYGNSHLTSNAKVILNEVTSTNPSQLNGYTEVAGKRADLVIANPNGIRVNGAGFINTSNVTLTTGRPNIVNGVIDSYNVTAGEIAIEGAGLDATQTDGAHLYASILRLNAKIYANGLDAKFASLDASALGGMYANSITLEGTSQGVGVTLPPEVIASNGDITISADGDIVLHTVSASNEIAVNSSQEVVVDEKVEAYTISVDAQNLTNQGSMKANSITLDIDQTLDNSNANIIALDNIEITTHELENVNAVIESLGDLSINTTTITLEDSQLYGANNLLLTAESLDNIASSQIESSVNLQIDVTSTIVNDGLLNAGDSLTINAKELINNMTIFSSNNMELNIEDTFTNNKDANVFAINNLMLSAMDILNDKGTIFTYNGDIDIYAKNLINTTDQMVINEEIISKSTLTLYAPNKTTFYDESYGGIFNGGKTVYRLKYLEEVKNELTAEGKELTRENILPALQKKYAKFGLIVKAQNPYSDFFNDVEYGEYYISLNKKSKEKKRRYTNKSSKDVVQFKSDNIIPQEKQTVF